MITLLQVVLDNDLEISGQLVRAGYGYGLRGGRMALFQSIDIGLLCDFAYEFIIRRIQSSSEHPVEARAEFDQVINETKAERIERIEREQREARKERMRFAAQFG